MAIESKTVIGQCAGLHDSPRPITSITLHFDMSGTSITSDSADPTNPSVNYTVVASGSRDAIWDRVPYTQRIGEFQFPGDGNFFMFMGCCCVCRAGYQFDLQGSEFGPVGPTDAPFTAGWADPRCDVTISGYPGGIGDGTFDMVCLFALWDLPATPCRSPDGPTVRPDLYTLDLRVRAPFAIIIGPNDAIYTPTGSNNPEFLTDGTGYMAFTTPDPCLNSQSYSVTVTTTNNVMMGTQSWNENYSSTFTLSIST